MADDNNEDDGGTEAHFTKAIMTVYPNEKDELLAMMGDFTTVWTKVSGKLVFEDL